MPNYTTELIGPGDQSWLGSTHAIWNGQTAAPDTTRFSRATYPTGVPSGTPVAKLANRLVPYAPGATDSSNVLVGFLFTDQKAGGEGGWPVIDHGRIRVSNLPVAFTVPAAANVSGQFVFVGV